MRVFVGRDRALLVLAIGFGVAGAVASAFVAILLQWVLDVAVSGDGAGFWRLCRMMAVYVLVLAALSLAEALCGKLLLRGVTQQLRARAFRGIMRRRPQAFYSEDSAAYLSAVVNDVKLIEDNLLVPLLDASAMVALFVATLGILMYLSPLVTGILLAFLLLFFLLPALLGKALERRQALYSEQLAQFTAVAKELFGGYAVLRSFAAGPYAACRFRRANAAAADAKFRADALVAVNEMVAAMISLASNIVVVLVAAWLVMRGAISVGTLLALIQLSATFSTPVLLILQNLPKIQGARPVLAKLAALAENADTWEDELARGATFDEGLVVRDLCFGYTPEQLLFDGLALTLGKGEKVALVGASGSGKSTLIQLLGGYTTDYGGSITYDGVDVRSLGRRDLSRLVALLPQNVMLFDVSLRENITLGEDVGDAALEDALVQSGVATFLPALEAGLDTHLGENGNRLSGGQRQRVALARALVRRAPILILDEGTSALDRETAQAIEATLLDDPALTLLVITHHLAETLAPRYDAIWTMSEGRLHVQRA